MQKLLTPRDPEEAERWKHTRTARRILDNEWETDAQERLGLHLSARRTQDVGCPSTALNIMGSVFRQIAVVYDTPATVEHEEGDQQQEELMQEILEDARWGGISQRNNYYTEGLRESLLHVQNTEAGIRLGIVTPDQVVIETLQGAPEDMLVLKLGSYIVGDDYKKKPIWEIWDISGETPRYYTADADGKLLEEKEYIWIDDYGPFIPFVKYRAQYTDDVWDYQANSAMVNGTLDIAVLWSLFFHVSTSASWPQRWGMDIQIPNAIAQDTPAGRVSTVETSPTSILMLSSKEGKDKASLGQFSPGGDPKVFADSVLRYQSTVLTNFGISPSDLEASLAAQSGIAIQLKRAAQRREALKSLPNYEIADTELLSIIARVNNITGGKKALDPWGWRVNYHLPELGSDERLAVIQSEIELYKIGISSMVDVLMAAKPSIKTREEAIDILLRVKEENGLLKVDVNEPTEEEEQEEEVEDE